MRTMTMDCDWSGEAASAAGGIWVAPCASLMTDSRLNLGRPGCALRRAGI